MKYQSPSIRTMRADEVLEAMGPVQGYGGSGGSASHELYGAYGGEGPWDIQLK